MYEYSHAVFQFHGIDPLSLTGIRWQCKFEERLLAIFKERLPGYLASSCMTSRGHSLFPRCCQSWHVANIAAYMVDKKSCKEFNSSDVETFSAKLASCAEYIPVIVRCFQKEYSNPRSRKTCRGFRRAQKAKCGQAYLFYLVALNVDDSYVWPNQTTLWSNENSDSTKARFASKSSYLVNIILPFAQDFTLAQSDLLPLIRNIVDDTNRAILSPLEASGSQDVQVELVALEMGVRLTLFRLYLLRDTIYGALAAFFVLLLAWVYTGSLCYTLAALFCVFSSLGIAYFTYRIMLNITFFPFMNLLTIVLSVGIGADDTFILRHIWLSAKSEKNPGTLSRIIRDTLSHACLSMFVTSLTTAAAFLSNYLSYVIAMKCFGVFACLTILINYFLVITWLVACLVFIDKHNFFAYIYTLAPSVYLSKYHPRNAILYLIDQWVTMYACWKDWGRVLFEKLLPCVVIKLRFVWILCLGGLSIGAAILILHNPVKWMPKHEVRFFRPGSELETWKFERLHDRFLGYRPYYNIKFYIQVLWGVKPSRVGSGTLNPKFMPPVEVDTNFHFQDTISLLWLRHFCHSIAAQDFVDNGSISLGNCFAQSFLDFMGKTCSHEAINTTKSLLSSRSSKDRSPVLDWDPGVPPNSLPCCKPVKPGDDGSELPYSKDTLHQCLIRATQLTKVLKVSSLDRHTLSGMYFNRVSGQVGAIAALFPSETAFSYDYEDVEKFYKTVDKWFKSHVAGAMGNMREGFWTSGEMLLFFDLQQSLAWGTVASITIALVIAGSVLLLSTHNILSSILAVFSIGAIVVTTIACLILLGWRLNIVEATIIILVVGLSFDFTLHYAVAYGLSEEPDREGKVIYAVSSMGSPIFMSFVTTFAAGVAMSPAITLAYYQIGVFMMLITLISWTYSTLFFMSILYVWGPTGQGCDVFAWFKCCFYRCCVGPARGQYEVGQAVEPAPSQEPCSKMLHFHHESGSSRTPSVLNHTLADINQMTSSRSGQSTAAVITTTINRPDATSSSWANICDVVSARNGGRIWRPWELQPLARHGSLETKHTHRTTDPEARNLPRRMRSWHQSLKSSLRRVTGPISRKLSTEPFNTIGGRSLAAPKASKAITALQSELSTPISAKSIFTDPDSNTLAFIDDQELNNKDNGCGGTNTVAPPLS